MPEPGQDVEGLARPAALQGAAFPVAGGSMAPPGTPAPLVPQVRLCHHAQVAQQDDSRQTVGAALDQELPVWGALAADAPELPLTGGPGPCK